MKLYDRLIEDIEGIFLTGNTAKAFSRGCAGSGRSLSDGRPDEILLRSDTAFELGANPLPCVSTLAVSSGRAFDNETYLSGPDLPDIKADTAFGKAVFAQIGEFESEQELFNAVKKLEAVRFKYVPAGFMVRASALNMREQIRVGKSAAKAGYSFYDYGRFLITKFLSFPFVKSCAVYFATDENTVKRLKESAEKIHRTTSALNHILDNVLVNCSSCNFRSICDETEGFREMHMRMKRN